MSTHTTDVRSSSAPSLPAELLDIPVEGGELRVSRIGSGRRIVLGLHGLAGSRVTMEPIARYLGNEFTFVAVDMRGRGMSSSVPGPYGLDAHARDCVRVMDALNLSNAVVVGHSMGAFVGERLAVHRPDLVRGLVLMDGGIPLPLALPAGMKIEDVMNMAIGPILETVTKNFPTEDAFLGMWRAHPGWAGLWTPEVEARFRYEMTGTPPNIHSRISAEALKDDMRDVLIDDMSGPIGALRQVKCPVELIRAPRGLLNQPAPTITDEAVATWSKQLPQLVDTMVPDTNHVTLGLLDHALQIIAGKIHKLSS